MNVQIEDSWKEQLKNEFRQPYFTEIANFLKAEKAAGKVIYPPGKFIFNAFNTTPFNDVKVVILGQDPYHNPGQAHGLSFSVPLGVPPPPSLVNIFKEQHEDLGIDIPNHGNLEKWAKQGVLLLNAALTVEANKPMSHSKIGWHHFTDDVIRIISEKKDHVVFMLWGSFAKSKQDLIDKSKHLVLTAAHPSPLSAHNGFFGCHHFSKANKWLQDKGMKPIDWALKSNE
ncbi:MAG: uracil-DNA glycosylase [Bacteroidetes bacterium 43-93]|nr:uracil-DNA glycosylase [Bacteroidota bacterium]OJW98968.1 MAG: uracil-DNA glycosylase [Bacteroidetes bacterium 43-93]